jgi:hypothetical protein
MVPNSRTYEDRRSAWGIPDHHMLWGSLWGKAYFCISDAEVLTPLHNRSTKPANATLSRNRVRVRKTHIARVGGN